MDSKSPFHVVTTPQIGANDEFAVLQKWYAEDRAVIHSGDLLCALETSKAVFDIEAEASGYLLQLVSVGKTVKISQPIALIGTDMDRLISEISTFKPSDSVDNREISGTSRKVDATQKAKVLAEKLGINLEAIASEGIIREKDVISYHERSREAVGNVLLHNILDSLKSDRKLVAIYGAGRGGATVAECLNIGAEYQACCFIDDNPDHPQDMNGLPVFHSSRINELHGYGIKAVALAVANGKRRLQLLGTLALDDFDVINAIHPSAFISPSAVIGTGNHIKAGAIVDTATIVGNCCIIDNGAIIAHDNMIGDGCHIAPGVSMGSSITLGKCSVIGIGASIATCVNIGESVIVSVGSSVIKDVPDHVVVEGVPGKIIGARK